MLSENTPITGDGPLKASETPKRALAEFYYAFNNGDMDRMSQNWMQSEDIAMDNPLGDIKRGWNEIQTVYERVFNGPAQVYVEFYDYTIHQTSEMFYAVGRERGHFILGDIKIPLRIRTSRIFQLEGKLWKQVHHHGSIEDAELLDRYQKAVMQK